MSCQYESKRSIMYCSDCTPVGRLTGSGGLRISATTELTKVRAMVVLDVEARLLLPSRAASPIKDSAIAIIVKIAAKFRTLAHHCCWPGAIITPSDLRVHQERPMVIEVGEGVS